MGTEDFTINNWYAAKYDEGFSIIFRIVKITGSTISFLRKDGVIVDSIPCGYSEITFHRLTEPEY